MSSTSSSSTTLPSTGIDPENIRDSLDINITPARRTHPRLSVVGSPGDEDMPISGVNTPQRSTLARNNPFNKTLPCPEGGIDPASPINAAGPVNVAGPANAAASNTGVTTTITGGTATATATTNAAALDVVNIIIQRMKGLIQFPIVAVRDQIRDRQMKRDATTIQKANIAENKRQRALDAVLINSINKGFGGDGETVANGPAGNQLGESSSSATATTATTNVPAANAMANNVNVDNNTNFRSVFNVDLYGKVKAVMAKKRWNANYKKYQKTIAMAQKNAVKKGTGNKKEGPKRPYTA